jgi:redox-sensitive bicupin YhaK (pirin superfamily)
MSSNPVASAPAERIIGRVAEIGTGFKIARLVPSRQRRTIGAWCFLDHAGPVNFTAGGGMHVGPHPHIGLQTFTWMISGEVRHLDSLGNDQLISPHQVNLMTAGRGISHAEIAPNEDAGTLHAAQLWIALPDAHRHTAPQFQHYPDLPVIEQHDFIATVLVGSYFGATSPVAVYTPLLGVDLVLTQSATLTLPLDIHFEHGITLLEGSAVVEGQLLAAGELLYFGVGHESVTIQADAGVRVLLIGGEPFVEDIILWWNFVARTQAEMTQARADWVAESERFGTVAHLDAAGSRLIAPSLDGIQIKGAHG